MNSAVHALKRLAAILSLAAAALPAAAEPIVVEVFASQNCTACPKAHANMADLQTTHDDLLILTWSVDYWDYLGAPDPMAMPEAMERQAAYAEHFGLRGPYTPQTVYDGVEQCAGNKMRRVRKNLAMREGKTPTLSFTRSPDGAFSLTGEHETPVEVSLLHIAELPQSDMVNPVLSVTAYEQDQEIFIPECQGRCVLIAQNEGFGEIKAAIWVRD